MTEFAGEQQTSAPGDSTTDGGGASRVQRPRTMADDIVPTPTKPYRAGAGPVDSTAAAIIRR